MQGLIYPERIQSKWGLYTILRKKPRVLNPYKFPYMLATIIGLIAATCTTISFLPQVIKTWKSKSAKDLSLGMFLIFCIGTLLWLIYGILVKDIPVISANSVTLVLSSILVYFKVRYKN